MSVDKLLKRVVAPDIVMIQPDQSSNVPSSDFQALHDYTHGITSDPLTQFAIILSALIHDTDHRGVSNAQLATEDPSLAAFYKNKSIAEQNSLDLAWDTLMLPEYCDLRNCIYTNKEELQRFRQTLVNVVLATDIFDKDLNGLRKQRWEAAFASAETGQEKEQSIIGKNKKVDCNPNVKATIVIEHLIQASDVAHTMQHWHIYRKWNERLFWEMDRAYQTDRMGKDPAEFWYHGEISFLTTMLFRWPRN